MLASKHHRERVRVGPDAPVSVVVVHLYELGQGVFALVAPETGFGHSNLGLVIDADGLTLIDAGPTPTVGREAQREVLELTAELELPLRRLVLTSSRVPFSGGTEPLRNSFIIGSEVTSDDLDHPANTEALRRLLPDLAAHYHQDFRTRPVSHVIDAEVQLTPAMIAVPLPGESLMNLIIQVPGADVVFAGALASFGVTPLCFAGDPAAWLQSLGRLAELGSTIVPGHGTPGGHGDLVGLAEYLAAVVASNGDPSAIGSGPWEGWTDRHFDGVNCERALRLAHGDADVPDSYLRLLGFT